MMEEIKELTDFYMLIQDDSRIGATHISLYMALFQLYNLNKRCNPIHITRAEVMRKAKISGVATYHKCIKDLSQFGYIQYNPSFNPGVRGQVSLLAIR